MMALLIATAILTQNQDGERPAPVAVIIEIVGKPTNSIAGVVKPLRRLDLLRRATACPRVVAGA